MKRITKFSLLLSLVLGLYFPTVFAQSNMTNEMFDLAKLKSGVKNKRISSTDPTGGNRDHLEPFKPGEKRIIADIKGTGVINHIWVTIAPPPPTLSRNDIIIRMYWDGNDYPSVESPIGPFFGQGWTKDIIMHHCLFHQVLKTVPACHAISLCLLRKAHVLKSRIKVTGTLMPSIST